MTRSGIQKGEEIDTPETFFTLVLEMATQGVSFTALAELIGDETTLGEMAAVENDLGFSRNTKQG